MAERSEWTDPVYSFPLALWFVNYADAVSRGLHCSRDADIGDSTVSDVTSERIIASYLLFISEKQRRRTDWSRSVLQHLWIRFGRQFSSLEIIPEDATSASLVYVTSDANDVSCVGVRECARAHVVPHTEDGWLHVCDETEQWKETNRNGAIKQHCAGASRIEFI